MVMTSSMYHIFFEPARESEYIIIMNGIRRKPIDKGNVKLDTKKVKGGKSA